MARAQAADAVLLGAVGGPKYDDLDFALKPERGLLRLRKEMDLYANLRPAQCFDALADFSSLKREVVAGLDILIVRELTSGVYFGEPRGIVTEGNQRVGINTQRYTEGEIARVARVGLRAGPPAANKVCSMEKANVMESGVLWRQVVTEVHAAEYPDVELSHMYADAGAHAAHPLAEAVRRHRHRQPLRRPALRPRRHADRLARHAALGLARRADGERPAARRSTSRCTARRPTSPARARPTRSPASSPSPWRCATPSTPATRRRASRPRSSGARRRPAHRRPARPGGRHAGLHRRDGRRDRRGARPAGAEPARDVRDARRSHTNARGAAFALIAFGIYSTHDVVVKFLGGVYSPFQIVFFANLFGFPIVTVMLMRDRDRRQPAPAPPVVDAAAHRRGGPLDRLVFYAFSVLPMAQTYAMIFAAPLLITILAIPILGETRRLAALAGGRGRAHRRHRGAAARRHGLHRRPLAALGAAVCSAVAAVIVRKIGHEERSAVLLLYPMMANFIVMGLAMPFVYQPMPALAPRRRGADGAARLRRRALHHRRLPHRQRRGGGADAVLADPLGGGLRLRLLRRDPRPRHRASAPRSSS